MRTEPSSCFDEVMKLIHYFLAILGVVVTLLILKYVLIPYIFVPLVLFIFPGLK